MGEGGGAAGALLFVGAGAALLAYRRLRKELKARLRRPLVELHVHLDGSFDNRQLYELAKAHPERLEPQHRPLVEACKSFEDFEKLVVCRGFKDIFVMIKCFDLYLPLVRGDLGVIEEQAYAFVLEQARQNVVYTEVRYSPHLLCEGAAYETENGAGLPDGAPVVDAVTRGLRRGCAETGVVVNQIMCCLSFRPDWAMATVELTHRYAENWPCAVVGVDIAAGEAHFEVSENPKSFHAHTVAFQRAQELGLNVTLHAGEVGLGEHVEQAVRDFGAVRVGHGYQVLLSPDILQRMVDQGVLFEVCPTSSFETGSWKGPAADIGDWTKHPLLGMLEAGAKVCVNSDDPSVFQCTLEEEIDLVCKEMGVPTSFIRQSTLDAIDGAFCHADEKERLRAIVNAYYA
uniref:adenosine deaminase n=1 Tax=Phaeomonas parva TaxID=124430 RepID=A0A7S1UGV6_9STRA|mmetsp:Transcript_5117/g.14531  ORF Transcript_5117/g.14531 Transcript_5117/m.14531 type:complete len:401 (+) Transcript_5117:120-1322(+)